MASSEIINAVLLLSSLTYCALGQSDNGFIPSKDIYNGNGSVNNSNTVNHRYFNQNFHQFYNPHSYSKYNSLFYPNPSYYHNHNHHHNHYQRQIRVPGIIEIRFRGQDAEIKCEFDRYLILIQGIYWHRSTDSFGSYFDTRNQFAPHVTVTNVNPWKSILTIKDFTADDEGPYKCISTALLPDEPNLNFQSDSYGYPDVRTNQLEESKRKVRFTRELKDQTNFNPVYDPFVSNYLGLGVQQNYQPLVPNIQNNYLHQLNPYLGGGHYNHNPNANQLFSNGGYNLQHWSVHAPYYKPRYSASVVYQEVIFPAIPSTTLSPGK